MKRLISFQILAMGMILCIILQSGCTRKREPQHVGTTPAKQEVQQPVSTIFAIAYPTSNSLVDRDIVTVRGTGASANTSVEIDVFTDQWYPQNGYAEISSDGTWAYSPCYLKGQGSYKRHHNIRARLMQNDQQIGVNTVYDVAVQ
jgi:FlaG/FlaF family flagellin (archaellin)